MLLKILWTPSVVILRSHFPPGISNLPFVAPFHRGARDLFQILVDPFSHVGGFEAIKTSSQIVYRCH